MTQMRRTMLVAAVLIGAVAGGEARAASPCGKSWSMPAGPPPGASPAVEVWRADEGERALVLAGCGGSELPSGTVLVAVSGTFREPGGIEAVLGRLGAVSRQLEIQAWNGDKETWQPLLEDAAALAGPDAEARRSDFAPGEFRKGAKLHVLYDDADPVGPIVYRMAVHAIDAGGFTLVTKNVVPGRLMGFTMAAAGGIHGVVTVRKEGSLMRYHALTAIALAPMAAAMVPDAAHVSRAVATFRYLAGIPTDREPPPAAG